MPRTLSTRHTLTHQLCNVTRALQLGYDEQVVQLMQKLPYLKWTVAHDEKKYILGRTAFVNYTNEEDLKEGRRPYPYCYMDNAVDLDPWLLPLMLPWRDGWLVLLDTRLGAIRAFAPDSFYRPEMVEFLRHGPRPTDPDQDPHSWRRVPTVPVMHYFNTLIRVYRSLERLPIINPDRNDPAETRYIPPHQDSWLSQKEWKLQSTLLDLYRECGWPDAWRRTEFLVKWRVKKAEIDAWARE
ncbi:SWIM-type domain-containing protein [Mycena indigotica]|uniref:SWIM-type domain-containing protein n=1 Tax=Mycena indigotica TaxID=2126181 RepID=A0A8H6SUF3_9AGAR|nr:SWIM-type domain-containing protein [Mycena indigotica]KAF7306380.1 SWIM-type domain-containing protein [Mycena indigotica]